MSYMFHGASTFNGDISKWDVSNVKDMRFMFYRASTFNGDISQWDVSSVTDMKGMFTEASTFKLGLGLGLVGKIEVTFRKLLGC